MEQDVSHAEAAFLSKGGSSRPQKQSASRSLQANLQPEGSTTCLTPQLCPAFWFLNITAPTY